MISVITPTTRPEGLALVAQCMAAQSTSDWEWLIVTPCNKAQIDAVTGALPYTYVPDPPPTSGDVWTLNKAYNAALRQSKGEVLVSWQDFVWADQGLLLTAYSLHEKEPRCLVSYPLDSYSDTAKSRLLWRDPRGRSGEVCRGTFSGTEWNLLSGPIQALYDVGGFDEELDKAYGLDGYGVNERLKDLGGYEFRICRTVDAFHVVHEKPKLWEELNAVYGFYQNRMLDLKEEGRWPVLHYVNKKEEVLA